MRLKTSSYNSLVLYSDALSSFSTVSRDCTAGDKRSKFLQKFSRAIALLLSNVQLPEVVDQMQDSDVAQVLFAAAARTELYPQEKAASAMEDILNGLRVQGIEAQLSALDKELSTCAPSGDRSRYLELLQNRQRLQREKDALKRGSSPSQN